MHEAEFMPDDLTKPLHIEFDDDSNAETLVSAESDANANAELIFDFFSPMNSARTAYGHFYRDVLSWQSVSEARKSVAKIDDLFEYFHRLNDFAGKHHAMILALTGRNQAKWKGLPKVAKVYDEWLHKH